MKTKSLKSKKNKIFWGIIIFLVIFLTAEVALRIHEVKEGQSRVEQLAADLKRAEREWQEEKAADTVGGNTPQETLQMFIDAVEAGDYELASKYFVIERQEEELESLQNSPKENIDNIIGLLKQTKNSEGSYSEDENIFVARKPILASFILYPSGNWKIEEI